MKIIKVEYQLYLQLSKEVFTAPHQLEIQFQGMYKLMTVFQSIECLFCYEVDAKYRIFKHCACIIDGIMFASKLVIQVWFLLVLCACEPPLK